ncbi:hypothetical protein FQN49_001196 [Arthroderma sp. PD_2]|nr:hypothetical protein FQN49_001196 [Arthroderma sp. PD_2]
MKFTQVTAVLFGMIAASEATRLNMCKAPNKQDCLPVDANAFVCTNLRSADGRPYVSGWSEGGTCDIYAEAGCTGTANSIDMEGWGQFPFPVWSVEC